MAGLPSDAAERIAISLSELLGVDLHSDWVQIRKTPIAGVHEVVVVTEDVMARVRPYEDTNEWASVRDPVLVGWGLDGKPHYLSLRQHGQVLGKSGSGKSSLIHTLIAATTRCADAVQWVCGTEKLYDFVGEWIEPYDGTQHRIPIDWIAYGPEDTLAMLIAAMQVARWRQRQRLGQREGWPDIRITLDEASFALRNRTVRGVYEGQTVTMSDMAAMLRQGARSAGVFLDLASQRGTQDHWGDKGADVVANAGWTAAFQSKDWAEIGRNMGDYRLAQPRHAGEFWLDPGDGDPILLKAPYIQESDPNKARLHNGVTVPQVAWARRDRVTDLDAGSAQAAGAAYARRHRYADADLFEYLTGAPSPTGQPSLQERAAAVVAAQVAAARTAAGAAEPAAEPAAGPGVASMVGRRPRAERIAEIVRAAQGPVTVAEISDRLREQGDHAGQQVITNALGELVRAGVLDRPERGAYVAL